MKKDIKRAIFWESEVEKRPHDEIAKRHGYSRPYISEIVSDMRKEWKEATKSLHKYDYNSDQYVEHFKEKMYEWNHTKVVIEKADEFTDKMNERYDENDDR